MSRRLTIGLAVSLAAGWLLVGMAAAAEVPWGEDKAATDLPLVFKGRASERLAAEEVARHDAYRKLVERVYGLGLDARTDVHDLALSSRTVDVAMQNELRGMKEVGTKYHEDGRVEMAVKITMREVVEIIERTVERVERGHRLVSEETLENIKRENRDTEIIVVGRGALRGTNGLEKVRAMRAAETECYARIGARVFGLQISAETTVRDFALSSDSIRSKVSVALLNGVRFTDYSFLDDGTCEATGELTIREVVEVLTRTHRRYARGSKVKVEEIENLATKHRDLVIKEVGRGTTQHATELAPMPFTEHKTVMERVISREIAVE